MLVRAHAKINLCLDVTGVRPNGYHDVRMIMQSVGLYDELEINKREDTKIVCSCSNSDLICDESNLIYKAAKAIIEYSGKEIGVNIKLTKNIPIAAGMAGGSTDAAAVLVGINELFSLRYTNTVLREIGVKLGADIPFCIEGGTYLSEGIGEILTKLPDAPDCYLVIAKPDINVSTKEVYDRLILDNTTNHPDVDKMISCINDNDLNGIISGLSNLLANVTEELHPVINDIKHALLNSGARGALMSGSGPTVFAIFDTKSDAENALINLDKSFELAHSSVTTLSDTGIAIVC